MLHRLAVAVSLLRTATVRLREWAKGGEEKIKNTAEQSLISETNRLDKDYSHSGETGESTHFGIKMKHTEKYRTSKFTCYNLTPIWGVSVWDEINDIFYSDSGAAPSSIAII